MFLPIPTSPCIATNLQDFCQKEPWTAIVKDPAQYFFFPDLILENKAGYYRGAALRKRPKKKCWNIRYEENPGQSNHFNSITTQNLPIILEQIKHQRFKVKSTHLESIVNLIFKHLNSFDKGATYPIFFKGFLIDTEHPSLDKRILEFGLDLFANGDLVIFYHHASSDGTSKKFHRAVQLTNLQLSPLGRLKTCNPQKHSEIPNCNDIEVKALIYLKATEFQGIPEFQRILCFCPYQLPDEIIIYGKAYQADLAQLFGNYPISVGMAMHLGYQILEILDQLQKNSMVHRDIKFENLLIDNLIETEDKELDYSQTKVILGDWAFSCMPGFPKKIQGTFPYMDPAIILNLPRTYYIPDYIHDVWSVGITLWRLFFDDHYPVFQLIEKYTNDLRVFKHMKMLMKTEVEKNYQRLLKFNTPLAHFFQEVLNPNSQRRTQSAETLMELFTNISSHDKKVEEQIEEIANEYYGYDSE